MALYGLKWLKIEFKIELLLLVDQKRAKFKTKPK